MYKPFHGLGMCLLVLIGMGGFATSSHALSPIEVEDAAIFGRNFRTTKPVMFAQVAIDEGFSQPVFNLRLHQFAEVVKTDTDISSEPTFFHALKHFFLKYHGEHKLTDATVEGVEQTVRDVVKRALKDSVDGQRQGIHQQLTRGHSMRMMRNMGNVMKLRARGLGPQHAGEITPENFFQNASFTLSGSYAEVNDQIAGGDGTDRDISLWAAAGYGDDWAYGFGATLNRYEINSDPEIDQTNIMLDAYVTRYIDKGISVGAFVNYTHSKTEEVAVTLGSSTFTFGGTTETIGAGFLLNGTYDLALRGTDLADLSITTTIASMNKSNPSDLISSVDTLWLTQVELSRDLNSWLSASVYGTAIHLFDVEDSGYDPNYGKIGFDLRARPHDQVEIALGVEKGVFQTDYEDHRIAASITYWW